jgi:hypothetical protein
MDSLFKLWSDVLLHDNTFDTSVSKCFSDQVRLTIFNCEAVDLEYYFKRLTKDHQVIISEVFRNHTLFLLENSDSKWTDENIDAIKKLFHNDNLNWCKDEIIQSLMLLSQSHILKLLNIFPEILDDWFNRNFSDTKEKNIPKICLIWFKNLLNQLNIISSNEINFIFSVFQQIGVMYFLLGERINIWRDLKEIAIERVKNCSELQIFNATKFIAQIEQGYAKELFSDMIKEILNKTIQQSNDQLLNKIRIICDCNDDILEVPNP